MYLLDSSAGKSSFLFQTALKIPPAKIGDRVVKVCDDNLSKLNIVVELTIDQSIHADGLKHF